MTAKKRGRPLQGPQPKKSVSIRLTAEHKQTFTRLGVTLSVVYADLGNQIIADGQIKLAPRN